MIGVKELRLGLEGQSAPAKVSGTRRSYHSTFASHIVHCTLYTVVTHFAHDAPRNADIPVISPSQIATSRSYSSFFGVAPFVLTPQLLTTLVLCTAELLGCQAYAKVIMRAAVARRDITILSPYLSQLFFYEETIEIS